jgi:hypothetical protein
MRSLANSLKRLEGQQDGLLNPRNFAKKEAEEKDLRTKLAAKPDLEKQFALRWDNIAKAYAACRQWQIACFLFTRVIPARDDRDNR